MKQADIDLVLHAIATKFTNFETLDVCGRDSLDFKEVSAAAMKQALEAAFNAGWAAAKQGKV